MRAGTQIPTPTAAGRPVDISQIPPAVIGGTTAASMFAGLFWMLATGRLLTRSQHAEVVHIKDEQIADKDQQVVLWRAVGETSQAQMVELLEHGRLSVQILRAIQSGGAAKTDDTP